MTPDAVIDIFRQAIFIVILCVSVIIMPGLMIGLLVAMFQAATQINEMSLSFIPKLIITLMTLVIAGPWLAKTVVSFSQQLISEIPFIIG